MGLQVWLPLDGNINNQGLTPVTLSVGSPTYTSGKIGQCLNTTLAFNVSNNLITNLGSTNTYTMCCWCKNLNASASNRWVFSISSGTGTTRGLWENNSSTNRHWAYAGTGVSLSTSINTIDGNWHHICFTSADSVVKLYVDGIYQSQITSASTTAMTTNIITLNANNYNLNDFRLYDTVLSPREVKEISKGLVLHYPLAMPGQENLLLNTVTPVSWITTYTNADEWSVKDIYNMESPVNQLFAANDTATFSFDWEFTPGSSGSITGNFHLETGNVAPWILGSVSKSTGTRNNASNYIDLSATNTSGHVTCTFVVSSSAASAADTFRYFRIRWDKTPKDGTLKLSNCKLERGEIATPWIPNPADTAYSTLGFNDGIEYDVSGYERNGIKNNITNSSDTPRYNTSSVFDGSSSYISLSHSDFNPLLNGGTTPFTIAFWIYHADSTRGIIFGDYSLGGNNTNIELTTGHSIRFYWNGSPDMIFDGAVSLTTWAHVALVYNGTNIYFYKNGVLEDSRTVSLSAKSKVNGEYRIGRDARSDYTMFNGKLSDFRVYSTALSADDILELYHTPETLANNGALFTQGEFVES